MNFAFVVSPGHAEHVYTLGLDDAFYDFCFFELRVLVVHVFNRVQHLFDSLKELRLARMLAFQVLQDFLYVHNGIFFNDYGLHFVIADGKISIF